MRTDTLVPDHRGEGLNISKFIIKYVISSRFSMYWRRKWQHTLALLPGDVHGWRSLAGYPWGHKEWDTTERLTLATCAIYQMRILTI